MHTFTFRAMGSQILVAMDTDAATMYTAGMETARWFEDWEEHFSRFRPTSELNELNQHPDEFCQVSAVFWQVLKLALESEIKTNGIVTPTVLNALEEAGYRTSFENLAENMNSYLSSSFISTDDSMGIELREENHAVCLPRGTRLDFGGVAKGWAAQQAVIQLRDTAPVLVDAGGDIAVSGPLLNGTSWPIGIADPNNPDQSLGLVMLSEGGVATSGRDYRRWLKDNQWQHHLIDPRTHRPADTDLVSATIIASDVIEAEAWAKASVITGSLEGRQQLDQHTDLAYLLVSENGSTQENEQFTQYRWNEKWPVLQNKLLA